IFNNAGGTQTPCWQSVIPTRTGDVWVRTQLTCVNACQTIQLKVDSHTAVAVSNSTCIVGSGNWCVYDLGSVTSGVSSTFNIQQSGGGPQSTENLIYLDNVWVQLAGTATPATPIPPTSTPTLTPVPGTSTPTQTPTQTPVPIPGAMSTNIPTATECPGGCAVAALTQIPGLSTRVTVDTSPFSPLENLSLARSSCAPFGFALVPVPHIIGTPAFGS